MIFQQFLLPNATTPDCVMQWIETLLTAIKSDTDKDVILVVLDCLSCIVIHN